MSLWLSPELGAEPLCLPLLLLLTREELKLLLPLTSKKKIEQKLWNGNSTQGCCLARCKLCIIKGPSHVYPRALCWSHNTVRDGNEGTRNPSLRQPQGCASPPQAACAPALTECGISLGLSMEALKNLYLRLTNIPRVWGNPLRFFQLSVTDMSEKQGRQQCWNTRAKHHCCCLLTGPPSPVFNNQKHFFMLWMLKEAPLGRKKLISV